MRNEMQRGFFKTLGSPLMGGKLGRQHRVLGRGVVRYIEEETIHSLCTIGLLCSMHRDGQFADESVQPSFLQL